jgi:hypothetical protein
MTDVVVKHKLAVERSRAAGAVRSPTKSMPFAAPMVGSVVGMAGSEGPLGKARGLLTWGNMSGRFITPAVEARPVCSTPLDKCDDRL